MARTDDRNELSRLSALIDLMREKGVLKFQGPVPDAKAVMCVELLLGPPKPEEARRPKSKSGDEDPARDAKRAHYCNLLGRQHIADNELDLLP